ncbi:hypothetical protein FGG08_003216 [Glutinoglossum americanum]|uniref:Uncharacterized protein n=1 Tax=Glutinoglossum americanum TaxID=1670608 RepID=A0A9P8L4Y1_9PEZI|nr:hypothetical protein FGG08_003216 [Glutinoglossum americanum]
MSKTLRVRAPIDPIADEYANLKYDEGSGALYTETYGQAVSAAASQWAWRARGRAGGTTGRQDGAKGAPSLESSAMRSVLENLSGITVDVLQWVPWRIGERIWKEIIPRQLDSFHIWRVFVTVYHEEEEMALMYHRQSIIKPSIPLDGYVKPIVSESFHWITHLSISNVIFSRPELVNLSKLVNIGALDILASPRYPQSLRDTMEDSIVRAWSRAATGEGAFSKLRVLMLRYHTEITPRSLEYINCFPSLMLYNVTGCNITAMSEAKAHKLGWTCETGEDLLEALQRDKEMSRSWDLPILACFRRAGVLESLDQSKIEPVKRIDNLPVLNFRIGPNASEDLFSILLESDMLFFQRLPPDDVGTASESEASKKGGPEGDRLETSPPHKRRKLKVSKHKNFEELLKEFGSM